MPLDDFKSIAKYFPAPIRNGWGAFIDSLKETIESIPPDTSDATKEPSGFAQPPDTSLLEYEYSNRTLAISPVASSFEYFYLGVVFTITSQKSVQHPAVEGLHHFYFDPSGNLVTSQSVTFAEIIRDNVYVCNIYWSATDATDLIRGEERHGFMPWQSHVLQHEFNGGTAYGSGLQLGDMVVDDDGSLDTHCEFSVVDGIIVDEDIYLSIAARSAGDDLATLAKIGAGPGWTEAAFSGAPIVLSGGVPQVNTYSVGVWGQTPVTNNRYFLAHLFATNDWRESREIVAFQGEAEYISRSAARQGANQEISDLTTLGMPMAEFVAVATIIYQYKSSFVNSYKCISVSTESGEDYVSWLNQTLSPGASPSSHPNLTNRGDPNQHPTSSLTSDVDFAMGGYGFTEIGFADFDLAYAGVGSEGRVFWGAEDGTLNIGMPGGNVSLQVGQEVLFRARNVSGTTIENGALIYITGAQANRPTIGPARADHIYTAGCVGMATEEISNNKNGYVTSIGLVRGVDTDGIAEGSLLYLSEITAGAFTTTKPTAPDYTVLVGYVVREHASEGIVVVNPIIVPRLAGLSDVYMPSIADGDIPRWNTANGRFESYDISEVVVSAQGDIPRLMASHSLTLTPSIYTQFAAAFLNGASPSWASAVIYYEIVAKDGANDIQVETGFVTMSMIRSGSTPANAGATPVKSGTVSQASTGTMTVIFHTGVAGTDHNRLRVQATSDFSTPTITGYFTIIGNNDSTITWS